MQIRIIIPQKLRQDMLQRIHDGHFGEDIERLLGELLGSQEQTNQRASGGG